MNADVGPYPVNGPNHSPPLAPRFIRLRDAPHYLGMDKNRFNREVRPQLTTIPIAYKASRSTGLNSMHGRRTMFDATGVPRLFPKGGSHGTA